MKIEGITENMFAQAVALAQSGNMKNTIHCGGKDIFIFNMDNTILLKYKSPQEFPEAFSFFANDYESPKIHIKDGKIVFVTNSEGIKRTKVCPSPKTTFEEVKKIWLNFKPKKDNFVTINKAMVTLLESGLSHVELTKEKGKPFVLLQRDIYTGSRVEIEKSKSLLESVDDKTAFGPIGIRTMDLVALYTFATNLTFYIQTGKQWSFFEDNTGRLSGILAACLYDELGDLGKVEE